MPETIYSQFYTEQAQRFEQLQHQLRQAFDPFGLGETTLKAQKAWLRHPDKLYQAYTSYANDLLRLQGFTLRRYWGEPDSDVIPPHPDDPRFADPIWCDSPFWDSLKEWYLLNTRWLQNNLYATPGLDEQERSISAFWLRQMLNAMAPTNFLLTNPTALATALESRGASLAKGVDNFMHDMANGDIAMTDLDAFTVGENLATTAGSVVYRGKLLEVIHYEANTPTVHKVPLVLVSPWINKYYVLDLNPQKSMIKFLVDQGFSVFVTSWKNPDSSMAEVSLDDYLTDGVAQIIDVACEISGSDKVNLLGYCIGGTLVTTYLAWANRAKAAGVLSKVPVETATLLTTLTDFSRPGDIEVFIDEDGLDFIDKIMDRKGYLDGKDMAASFRMLRSNSLIWNYWASNYLLGETPMAFDVLYWNMDTTRMPKKMHRSYLRELYWSNKLVQADALTLAGQPIDLGKITQPIYMVSAEEDHIAPWKQTFTLVERVSGPVQFTLSTSGHIIGIINPPGPKCKRSYWQGSPAAAQNADDWLASQTQVAGSWWTNWVEWLRPVSGSQVKPKLSSRKHAKLCAAPGSYVLE
ncbi:alpha/beta fold hydrolase [Chitinibacter bivalviorum]|uniref:Alpha/beta fold hydrolase n=1 Tax=Chitinibacter bivalviorum TaxID=2739434 RepID=A0A7H9BMI3_9NEIS|nr:alpha/beta fold hydrolase [Chitinibacter bivalviorum]QLG88584.1 alpha/beta fold hydrolase [Chitinibacter bivalviorum]